MWDVYSTNFPVQNRQNEPEHKKNDARVKMRVTVDGCRMLGAV